MTATSIPGAPVSAADAFVARHQAGVWRFLRAIGCDAGHAEEHCQDALLAALHRGVDGWPVADASRWLRGAARNLHLMRLRAERRRPQVGSIDTVEAAWVRAGADDDGGAAMLAALDRCVEALPVRERRLIALRYEQRRSREEIAVDLGVGEAGVKQALRRLRARLRVCIDRRLAAMDDDLDPRTR